MSKRIIIAGGGTGGHIFPAVAIANALRKKDSNINILFVGAKGKMEMEKIPQAGYQIKGLDIAGFNRSSLLRNAALPFKIVKSFIQVGRIIRLFRPHAVIGVGGYSTFPVLRYAQSKNIPTFIHESNSFAGKANMMLGKKATEIFVASEGMEKFFPETKLKVTGNPIRRAIAESTVSREAGIAFFALDPAKTTVLVTGGSLGARTLNETLASSLDQFEQAGLQLIWQTGKPFADRAKQLSAGKSFVWTSDFIAEMQYAFAAADIVVSRSGAMAVAELCTVRKPVIFVPFPFAAEDHQTANAKQLVQCDAAILISDADARQQLLPALILLANDPQQQSIMKNNIGRLAVTDADTIIANEILKKIND